MAAHRPIWATAKDIGKAWRPMNYAARPYWEAMLNISSPDDSFHAETGRAMCWYFLSNAGSWRGPEAKALKAELKEVLK